MPLPHKVRLLFAQKIEVGCTFDDRGLHALAGALHYARAETAQAFVANILALLDDPRRAAALGEAGRRYVQGAHDWSVAARSLEAIYARLEARA